MAILLEKAAFWLEMAGKDLRCLIKPRQLSWPRDALLHKDLSAV